MNKEKITLTGKTVLVTGAAKQYRLLYAGSYEKLFRISAQEGILKKILRHIFAK